MPLLRDITSRGFFRTVSQYGPTPHNWGKPDDLREIKAEMPSRSHL
jgi:hypothetical protein